MFGDFELELTRPAVLLTALGIVPWLVWYFRRSLVDFSVTQRLVSLAARIVIVLLLLLALAGLNLLRPTEQQYIVVAVDDSLSIGEESRQRVDEFVTGLEEARGSHNIRYLRFANTPTEAFENWADAQGETIATDTDRDDSTNADTTNTDTDAAVDDEDVNDEDEDEDDDPTKVDSRPWRLGTNLGAAIEIAKASIPPFYQPQVVVLSDGNQTAGDATRATLAADIPISTVSLGGRSEAEVQVSSVNVPAQVRQGEPFMVEVVVDSNHDDEGYIEVFQGDVRVAGGRDEKITIKQGENRFQFRQEVVDQRQVNFTAIVSGFEDELLDNNTASGLVSSRGKPRVLLVDRDPASTDPLRWALEQHDIRVDTRPPQGIPSSLSDLQNYEAVILSNVPATDLTIRQMEVLRTYVESLGGGLMMLGGDQSFGLGGYYKTTLEEILPVRSDFEKEKEKPSLAMVLVIDRSGSMGGMKIELAKDAAKSAVELLGARDQIGIIAFDHESYWVSELHPAADKQYVIDRISTIDAGGGTNIYPGMADAYESLVPAAAKLKHIVLLSDGHSAPGDYEGITRDMVADRMTVSTVAVGSGADQDLLEMIARQGNGRYYFCEDPQSIPQIFAKETVTASKSAINEQPFLPQLVRPTQVLGQLDIEASPFLLGFVVTRPKPTCEFILATESGEPLLVWWRYGLGMTLAFTSDAKARWAAEWLAWPDFGTFWAQLVRHVMRKDDARGVYVEVDRKGEQTEVRVDTVGDDGAFRNFAETELTVIGPRVAATPDTLPMRQVAPGRYTAEFNTSEQGAYQLEIVQKSGSGAAFRQSRGLVVGYPDELRLRPTNEDLLRKIAAVSGGRYNPSPDEVFDIAAEPARRAEPLWPWLVAAAMLLLLADVALRRIDFALVLGNLIR